MSKITGVTILLVILAVSFYHSTASQSEMGLNSFKGPKGPKVPKDPIRHCWCTVIHRGKKDCPKPVRSSNYRQIQALDKCLCSKQAQPKFKTACEQFRKLQRSLFLSTPL